MEKKFVIYHADCPDGLFGAWAAWKKFGSQAVYVSRKHSDPIPQDMENSEIYLIDISLPSDELKKLSSEGSKIYLIDHHKSNIESSNTYPGIS